MFDRRSALGAMPGNDHRQPAPLRIGEVRGFGLVQVEAFADTEAALAHGVQSTVGVDLSIHHQVPSRAGESCVFRVGAGRSWIVGPCGKWVDSLSRAIPPAVGSVTNLSHSRTRLFIDGPAARDVLSKGIAIDLHDTVFPCNAYALTGLAHTPILIHRTDPKRYELYALRTFAVHIWEWLTDAAQPLGFQVTDTIHLDFAVNPDSR